MNLTDKMHQVERLIADEHYSQAVIAAGGLLEALLSALYNDAFPRLAPAAQQEVLEKVAAIGKGKAVADFTLGQLVGLFREARLFEKAQDALGRKLPHLRNAEFSLFVELRNRAAHEGAEVQEDEANLFVSQLRVFLREAGYLAPPPSPPASPPPPHALRPWTQVVHLHPDVESGEMPTAVYAIDLGAVVAGDPNVPAVYRDPQAFFRATYLTSGLRRLLAEVLARLADVGPAGDRVLQLRSPFGGGKSHVLLSLYHAARDHAALAALPEAGALPDPGPVRIAVFDGEKFDAEGKTVGAGLAPALTPALRVRTLWGWLAWQLGGEAAYRRIAYQDENRVSLGGDVIAELLGDEPTLILLDEVLKYLERVSAVPVGDSTLGRQTFDFLQNLSVEVAHSRRAVLVYSLQKSAREAMDNLRLLDILEGLTSRVDAKREPITGEEILPVLHRRLLARKPEAEPAQSAAAAYAEVVTRMRAAQAGDAAARRLAEDESLKLRQRIADAYPFHPALIDLMRERWAAIPDFQRTRGALRFLATCLHAIKVGAGSPRPLLGPGDIPIADTDVRYAFFTEVGQRDPFQPVLQHDFIGPNARTRRIDERLARENPTLSGVHPAARLGTAILMYSFGGLPRDESVQEGELLPPGVTEAELLTACVGPDLDSITAQAALKELREHCLYLHYDGTRYVFKTIPNVTQLIEEEVENVQVEEVRAAIKEELGRRLAGKGSVIVWPTDSQQIPDALPAFTLAYLPLEFADLSHSKQEARAVELFSTHGERPRRYRNALGLAIPDRRQTEPLRRGFTYLKAIERVESKKARLNLTREQLAQLKERRDTEQTAIEASLRALYPAVWLPRSVEGGLGLERVEAGGRPLQSTGVHERLMELLTIVPPPRLFESVTPGRIVELMRLGEGEPPRDGVAARQVMDAFFETLGFPRVTDDAVIRRAIAQGVRDGVFGYVGQARLVREEGGVYQVKREHVAYRRILATDEINLDEGLLLLATALPEESEEREARSGEREVRGEEREARGEEREARGEDREARGALRLKMTLNRRQLYQSFQAIGNLTERAGAIRMTVEAEAAEGFDSVWLRNAVIEPLEEADIEIEEG